MGGEREGGSASTGRRTELHPIRVLRFLVGSRSERGGERGRVPRLLFFLPRHCIRHGGGISFHGRDARTTWRRPLSFRPPLYPVPFVIERQKYFLKTKTGNARFFFSPACLRRNWPGPFILPDLYGLTRRKRTEVLVTERRVVTPLLSFSFIWPSSIRRSKGRTKAKREKKKEGGRKLTFRRTHNGNTSE